MTGKIITIQDIAKSLKIKPRDARRRLRAAKHVPAPASETRWAWPASKVPQVKKVLGR